MRVVTKIVLAGVGIAALAGGAVAADRNVHVMKVALPDGSVEQIRYVGDQPPRIALVPVDVPMMAIADPMADFAGFDRLFADLQRQQDAMMQQAAAIATARPGDHLDEAALRGMPAGTVSYSFVSSTGGNGTCSQSYQMTSYGNNQPPKVISQTSGNCSAVKGNLLQTGTAPAAPAPARPIQAKAEKPAPKPADPHTI